MINTHIKTFQASGPVLGRVVAQVDEQTTAFLATIRTSAVVSVQPQLASHAMTGGTEMWAYTAMVVYTVNPEQAKSAQPDEVPTATPRPLAR